MTTREKQTKYNEYLRNHIKNVWKAYEWMKDNLEDLFKGVNIDKLDKQIKDHDSSKWDEEEYMPYANYFSGEKRTKEIEEAFDLAWLHHKKVNKHHWQYWAMPQDTGETEAVEMPIEDVIEMIADWHAFSYMKGNIFELFDWYDEQKDIVLHENTKKLVEKTLKEMKDKLEEQTAKMLFGL